MARTAAIWILALAFSTPALAAELKIEDIANDGCRNEPRLRVTFDKYCHKHIHRPPETACGGGGGSGGSGGMVGNSGFSGIGGGTIGGNGLGGNNGLGSALISNSAVANELPAVNSPLIVPPATPVPGPVIGRGLISLIICAFLFLVWRKHVKYRRTSSA